MCGIAGTTLADTTILHAMTNRMLHRGPDGKGIWLDDTSSVGLSHTRLAIIDLSPGGSQPMVSPCGRYVLTFNGEIYNHCELRSDLQARGEHFYSRSDTEVLLRLLMRDGLEALPRLIGMFAFALWDREMGEFTLVRDRLGAKPLLWGLLPNGGLAFASEIEALRAHPAIDFAVDREALSHYLACLYVPAPYTLYRGIRKLAPGHWLRWRDGQVTITQWWAPSYTGDMSPSVDEAVEELMPIFESAVRLRLEADVEVGCFLSGGIDSSVIAAMMARTASHSSAPPIQTFTMTFDERDYDERAAAAKVAHHIGSRHCELPASPQVADFLDRMVQLFGEPFGNPTALLIHDLSRKAREHVTVALAGDGGDEVFAGYPRYHGGLLAARYRRLAPRPLRSLAAFASRLIPESSAGRHSWRRAREFLAAGGMEAAEAYASWVEYFSPHERCSLLGFDSLPERPIAKLYRTAPSGEALNAMQQTDLLSFLPGNLLSYGDAMTMAAGLEVRLPLIDHRLVEKVGRFASSLRFAQGKKTLLKAIARRLLPSDIVDRPKLGFNPPMGLWLNGQLKGLVDRLTPARAAEMGLEWAPIAGILAEYRSGRRDHSLKIWSLVVLDAWLRGQGIGSTK